MRDDLVSNTIIGTVITAAAGIVGVLYAAWTKKSLEELKLKTGSRESTELIAMRGLEAQITGWRTFCESLQSRINQLVDEIEIGNQTCNARIQALEEQWRARESHWTAEISRLQSQRAETRGGTC